MESNKMTSSDRKSERGAALITTLLIAMLLLTVSGALIVTTSMSATTSIDSTAELQAYYGAETGLEAALDVLRGNVAPGAGLPNGTRIGYRSAVDPAISNAPSDDSTSSTLSGWLNYDNNTGRVTPNGAGFSYSITITDPEDPNGTTRAANNTYVPAKLLVRSIGYGPRNAVKQMEMIVERVQFDFNAVAALAMRSADDGTSAMTFTIGQSAAKSYSGTDNASVEPALPSFGVTSAVDVAVANDAITKGSTVAPVRITQVDIASLPSFLHTADNARLFLNYMQGVSRSMGRYYTSFNGYAGSTATPQLTFVNGNCNLDGGAGLLIVTGQLIANGNPNFEGVILVLGEGSVLRDGAGNGEIFGSTYVARFARSWPASENGQEHPFLAPQFITAGSGNARLQYDSNAVQRARNVLGTIVRDIREF